MNSNPQLNGQTERVLRLLRSRPERGLTSVDLMLPDVADGGKPITRLAARILELRDQGYRIESGERRQKCVVYRWKADPEVPVVPPREVVEVAPAEDGGDLGDRLFDIDTRAA